MAVEDKLIVALDFPTWPEAERLVESLPEVRFFKVGLEMYLASRGEAVTKLREMGKEVFLDLKFHDIPNTVAQACRQAVVSGGSIFNVHASGGRSMLKAAAQATAEAATQAGIEKPLLIAVTILTSMNKTELVEVMGEQDLSGTVVRLAQLTKDAGLDGVVASPQEIQLIRSACGKDFKIICPGVRPRWAATGDQKRVMTPCEAIRAGADYLVVGRPITKAENPREAALKVLQEMKEASHE